MQYPMFLIKISPEVQKALTTTLLKTNVEINVHFTSNIQKIFKLLIIYTL